MCITGRALALLSVSVTKVRESPPWRGGGCIGAFKKTGEAVFRRVPGAVGQGVRSYARSNRTDGWTSDSEPGRARGQNDRNDSAGAGRGVSGLTDQGDESTEGRIRLDK